MWKKLAKFILKYALFLFILIIAITAYMGWQATKITLDYDFTKAIPNNNIKYIDYKKFNDKFGEEGDIMVVGFEKKDMFTISFMNEFIHLVNLLKKQDAVKNVIAFTESFVVEKDEINKQFVFKKIFDSNYTDIQKLTQHQILFENYPIYENVLYNKEKNAYIIAINIAHDSIQSDSRHRIINNLKNCLLTFEQKNKTPLFISGLPYIRTIVGKNIENEMRWFLVGSLLLSAISLLLFFRSFSAMIMSLAVVFIGVIWSIGTMVLLGQKITILTALIPPLIVVIGVPNCIYFLNKYHLSFKKTGNKFTAIEEMISKMSIVTLYCNISAAIGFGVFAFTKSAILVEFGIVAGINIFALFIISLFFIPPILTILKPPTKNQLKYIDNKFISTILIRVENWTVHHPKNIILITALILLFSIVGLTKIKSEGFILDDMPKTEKIYLDLKWFEHNFGGVMPLEIMVDSKKPAGIFRSITLLNNIDELSEKIYKMGIFGKPISAVEGLKFFRQAYFNNDKLSFAVPSASDMAFISPYLKIKNSDSKKNTAFLNNYIDSSKRYARISINMQDIGTAKLPIFVDSIQKTINTIFDTNKYALTLTGGSITFLEGSSFIIKGLFDSIFWAFVLIIISMLFLFKSFKMLLSSIIPNIIPLVVTAGIMGWIGIDLKPSTVLVFSVSLGIVIDVTIRFLINYQQELPSMQYDVDKTLIQTIQSTGISIIYTSLVLIAGFVIFCWSKFGGTNALGWLTSLTLLIGTFANLIFLPVLISFLYKKRKTKKSIHKN